MPSRTDIVENADIVVLTFFHEDLLLVKAPSLELVVEADSELVKD